jgi:LysR family transcriptional regulator for metE and metH
MTSAGFRLLHSATKILDELARAELDIAQLSDGIEQVIRFGLPHYASFKWLPNVITYFQEKLPEISIEVSGDATKQPLDSLFRGDVDIIFISTASKQLTLNHSGYQSQFIVEDELLACLSKQNDNANQAFLTAEDFTKQTYITNSTIPEKDREYELLFKPAHQIPRQVLQVGFNDAIIELIKANIGISILSKRLLNAYLPTNEIVTKPIGKHGLNVYWHLIYSNQPEIALPAEVLANQLKLFVQSS